MRERLAANPSPEALFDLGREIALEIASEGAENVGVVEAIIRLTDAVERIEGEVPPGLNEMQNALLRRAGLFPYADPTYLEFRDQLAYEAYRSDADSQLVYHREQLEIIEILESGRNVILSAPTSFGKSLIIDVLCASKVFVAALPMRPVDVVRVAVAAAACPRDSVRMAGALVCARAAGPAKGLALLDMHYADDADWRVREMVAKAFDRLCGRAGYAASRAIIEAWLMSPRAGLRRAALEGLRPWTATKRFSDAAPWVVTRLASACRDADADVRRSAINALGDVGRTHPNLVRAAIAGWEADARLRSAVRRVGRHLSAREHPPSDRPAC